MEKKDLLQELESVIKSSRREREILIKGREESSMSNAQLELTKTVISANKNIVSAIGVAKSLINDSEEK